MKKTVFALPLAALLGLSACMNAGPDVMRNAAGPTSCSDIPHMATPGGLALRCGPQAATPYSMN